MSDPAPEAMARPQAQKHISGFLIFSIMLSVGGLFFQPLLGIGPVIGFVLALLGRKKVLRDPMLIGPKLALWCVGIAILSFGLQALQLYKTYPVQAFWQSVAKTQREFIETLRGRDYERLHGMMDPEYQRAHTAEDLEALLGPAFPGEASIDLGEAKIRADEFDTETFQKNGEAFMKESDGVLEFTMPFRIPVGEAAVDLDFEMRIRREGFASFSSSIRGLGVKPHEGPPEPEPESTTVPDEKPAEGTGDADE